MVDGVETIKSNTTKYNTDKFNTNGLKADTIKQTKTRNKITIIVIGLITALLLTASLFIHSEYKERSNNLNENSGKNSHAKPIIEECEQGEEKNCLTDNYCSGTKVCINGRWSDCLIKPMVCKPGTIRKCPLGICDWGIQECTPCGQWGSCK